MSPLIMIAKLKRLIDYSTWSRVNHGFFQLMILVFLDASVETSPVMIGTVPIYDSVIHHQKDLGELTAQDFLDTIRLHAQDGVDLLLSTVVLREKQY